ncbi:MAG: PIN domain-containing protein [Nitrososphaerales archaeon]
MKRKQQQVLPNRISIDSGVVLAYFLGEGLGELVKTTILPPNDRSVFCSRTAISELFYILCRRKGDNFAGNAVESFLRTNYVSIVSSDDLDIEAGRYKCSRAISLADCYVLAVAKVQNASAVFAKKEDDIAREIRRRRFDVRILFLEDF